MATADPAVLDDFLNRFRSQVDAGFGLIQGDVSGVLATLVTISIIITALLWAIDENQNVLASLVRKVLLVGFFAWLVAQWHALSTTVVNGFAALGLKAGGGAMTVSTFTTSPSEIVMAGIKVVGGLLQYVKKVAPGPIEFFAHIDVVVMAMVAAIGILIAFVILAVEIVVTIIEFHIVTLVAFVTVPFGVLSQTSFMSERAIGYVVSVGIKLMALAIVVSLGTTIFNNYTVSPDPGIGEDVGLLLAAVVMVMLALKVPAIAGALISGGPQLNAGGALMGAAGVAAGVAGGALAARALGGAVAAGWAAGATQVASAKSAAGAIPPGGASPPAGGGAPGGGGGSGGGPGPADFARAPVSSTVQTLRVASDRLRGGGPSPAPEAPPHESPRSPIGDLARGAATTAAQSDDGGPGMTATPTRRDDPEA
ncbi:MAG: P-type conjugative transfer protein TrbL [Caulobacterales bacterium]|nr:P-type conjugative transfer protein TrbL [Caulobacterales bacterium]